MELLVNALILAVSMGILLKGTDILLDSSVKIAEHFGISHLVISLTLVSLATSLPEVSISFIAGVMGKAPISLSNIVGTTIFNTCLIVGIAALIGKIKVHQKVIDRDCVSLILCYLALMLVFWFGGLNWIIGLAFLLGYIVYLSYLYRHVKTEQLEKKRISNLSKHFFLVTIGAIAIYLGAKFSVSSAASIASLLGISSWTIGATVLAGGSSLPELVVAIGAMKKKRRVMAIGTVIGSNVLDILLGLGLASLVTPLLISFSSIAVDLLFGLISSVLLAVLLLDREIYRKGGFLLLVLYFMYIAYLLAVVAPISSG